MIYDTSGYISDDKPELRPRTLCHERAASVGRSPITAVIKELSKISRRGQRAGYNDALQHIMDRTIRWEDEGIKSWLDYAVEHRRRKRKERHRPLLREIGFAEISFIVLADAREFHERTSHICNSEKRLNDS